MRPENKAVNKRQRAELLGRWAELKAALWLMLTGHRVLELRYKTNYGEIDILAKKSDLIIAVEVKARKSVRDCLEAVTPHSQQRIHDAVDIWLAKQRKGEMLSVRFDIMAIVPGKLPQHHKNMF